MRTTIIPILTIAVFTCLSGCSSLRREVDIKVTNNSSTDADSVEVYFPKHFVMGPHCIVPKGSSKTYKDYPHASANSVTVEWLARGKNYRKEVDLKDVLPRKGSGRLVFVILDESVAAHFEKKD